MALKIFFLFAQYIIFCNQCYFGHAKPIIGENVRRASGNEFPFIVSLMRRNDTVTRQEANHFCTGSLISSKDILTADHCFEEETLGGLYISAESFNLRTGKKYYILWWISYNQWAVHSKIQSEFSDNDIAIIRLQNNVHPSINRAVISPVSGVDFFGYDVTLAGWGLSNNGLNPNIMEIVDVKVLSMQQCKSKIEKVTNRIIALSSNFICTKGNPYGLLQYGDSGGPVIYRGTIIGINRSICPSSQEIDRSKKVNIHLVLDTYKSFITDVKLNY